MNERMCVETAFSLGTVICDLKRIRYRLAVYVQTRLFYVSAMFNVLLDLLHLIYPNADPYQMSITEFSPEPLVNITSPVLVLPLCVLKNNESSD